MTLRGRSKPLVATRPRQRVVGATPPPARDITLCFPSAKILIRAPGIRTRLRPAPYEPERLIAREKHCPRRRTGTAAQRFENWRDMFEAMLGTVLIEGGK